MKTAKKIIFILLLIISLGIITYEKVLQPQVNKLNINIKTIDYYKLMWFGENAHEMSSSQLDSILQYKKDSVYIIDLRPEKAYFEGHIYGSLSMTFHDFMNTPVTDFKKIKKQVVFISDDGKLAELAVKLLLQKSLLQNISYLENGINDWEYRRYEGHEDFPKKEIVY